jgi:hypothetical protein
VHCSYHYRLPLLFLAFAILSLAAFTLLEGESLHQGAGAVVLGRSGWIVCIDQYVAVILSPLGSQVR